MSETKSLCSVTAALLAISAPAAGTLVARLDAPLPHGETAAGDVVRPEESQAPAELLIRNFSPLPIHGRVFFGDTTLVVFVPLGGKQTIWLRARTATVDLDGPPRFARAVDLTPRGRVVIDYPATR